MSLDPILNIITPVFGVLALGYTAARQRWFDEQAERGLSLFVFNFIIPPLLLRNMAQTELPATMPWGLLFSYYLGTLGVFACGMLAGMSFGRRLSSQGVFGFSAAFGNTVLIGVPLVLAAFGEAAALPLFLPIAVHSPLLMTLTTVIIELGRGRRGAVLHRVIFNALKGIASNPIMIGLLLGLVINVSGNKLPGPVDAVTKALSQAAMPCALFVTGAALSRHRLAGNLPQALALISIKNMLHPLLVWLLASYVFHLPPLWIKVAVLLAALPTGVNAYLFAQRYNHDIATVTSTIFLSTLLSVLSLSLLLMLLDVL